MANGERNTFIKNFAEYICYINIDDLLFYLERNEDLCNIIIDNHLFWKNIDPILKKFGINSTLRIFYILGLRKNDKFIKEGLYLLFDNKFINKKFCLLLFKYINEYNLINYADFYNIINYILTKKSCYKNQYVNYNFLVFLINNGYKKVIEENFLYIVENYSNMFELKEIFSSESNLSNKLNIYFNNNSDMFISRMIKESFGITDDELEKEKIFDTIKIIIQELMSYEGIKNYSDISFLGEGSYSCAFSIGSKVLKIGQKREVFYMKNNRRFLKPILRTEINKIDSDEVLGCIEITEKVNRHNINEKDVYTLYKELRNQGYFWVDCSPDNVGRLIKKNKVYFNCLEPFKEAIGYTTYNNDELDQDELVIIDNDYIYTEEEFIKFKEDSNVFYSMMMDYELMYQTEKKKLIK